MELRGVRLRDDQAGSGQRGNPALQAPGSVKAACVARPLTSRFDHALEMVFSRRAHGWVYGDAAGPELEVEILQEPPPLPPLSPRSERGKGWPKAGRGATVQGPNARPILGLEASHETCLVLRFDARRFPSPFGRNHRHQLRGVAADSRTDRRSPEESSARLAEISGTFGAAVAGGPGLFPCRDEESRRQGVVVSANRYVAEPAAAESAGGLVWSGRGPAHCRHRDFVSNSGGRMEQKPGPDAAPARAG